MPLRPVIQLDAGWQTVCVGSMAFCCPGRAACRRPRGSSRLPAGAGAVAGDIRPVFDRAVPLRTPPRSRADVPADHQASRARLASLKPTYPQITLPVLRGRGVDKEISKISSPHIGGTKILALTCTFCASYSSLHTAVHKVRTG
jgi:hypothetical protein